MLQTHDRKPIRALPNAAKWHAVARLRPSHRLVERVNDWHPPLAPFFQDVPVQAQAESCLCATASLDLSSERKAYPRTITEGYQRLSNALLEQEITACKVPSWALPQRRTFACNKRGFFQLGMLHESPLRTGGGSIHCLHSTRLIAKVHICPINSLNGMSSCSRPAQCWMLSFDPAHPIITHFWPRRVPCSKQLRNSTPHHLEGFRNCHRELLEEAGGEVQLAPPCQAGGRYAFCCQLRT